MPSTSFDSRSAAESAGLAHLISGYAQVRNLPVVIQVANGKVEVTFPKGTPADAQALRTYVEDIKKKRGS